MNKELESIRQFMLSYVDQYCPIGPDGKVRRKFNRDEIYDDTGHCGDQLWIDIRNFWEGFTTESDLVYVATGRYASDDMDLDGGRDYILTDSEVIPMIFEYLYCNMNWNKNQFQKSIHNSLGITDEIEEMYDNPPLHIARDKKLSDLIK